MNIEIEIIDQPIVVDHEQQSTGSRAARPREAAFETGGRAACTPNTGALAEFRGIVRDQENGQKISALEYEAYSPMAEKEMRRILESLAEKFPCLSARVVHRIGTIPVGEVAIYVGITAKHRGEAFAMLAGFMDRLKQDVPIWKRGTLPIGFVGDEVTGLKSIGNRQSIKAGSETPRVVTYKSLDEALGEISSRCQPLPGVRVPLAEAFGRTLRETVLADQDLPASDKSTRDGYAILENDPSEIFSVVDTVHAADWKPRVLKTGEAVRIATGGSLPCDGVRVVMQENVERTGDQVKIIRREASGNLRKRGEEIRAGQPVLAAGTKLDAGALAMLATVGCAHPLVSPKLRVVHLTTGDEIVPPDKKPGPGQIRDSNSILIRSLLQNVPCELMQMHLPENFEQACRKISAFSLQPSAFDLCLVSGGASVGERDFTRPLLEWLGFEVVFNRVNIRPGAPLIFGMAGGASVPARRIAFGLPGNPLSHFVCYQLFVAAALARMTGAEPPRFSRGTLAAKLEDASNPRETLWPACYEMTNGRWELRPLHWSSSGDVTCLMETNALVRIPAQSAALAAGADVDFIPTEP